MGRLSRHGIFLGSRCRDHVSAVIQFGNGNQGVVGYHALVHAVKRQTRALRIPKQSALNAELIAVYALAIDHIARAIAGHLARVAPAIGDKEVIILDKRCGTALVVPFCGLRIVLNDLPPLDLSIFEVDEHTFTAGINHHQRFVGIGERCHAQALDLQRISVQACPFVELSTGKQHFFLAVLCIYGPTSISREANQLVSPPHESAVFGYHVPVIGTAEVQVFKGELLLRQHGQYQQGDEHE